MSLARAAENANVRSTLHLGEAAFVPKLSGQGLSLIEDGVPGWWAENGNRLYAAAGSTLPTLQGHPGLQPPENATVVIGPNGIPPDVVLLWGDEALVIIGRNCLLPAGTVNCGGGSSVILGESISCTHAPTLNSRNGGLISVRDGGLWSSRVTMFTDDMHAILDAETGARLNTYGGCVSVDRHVWLGFDAMLLPGTAIGADSVIGARAVVNSSLPSNSICVGTPARPVRSGITWSEEDIPT